MPTPITPSRAVLDIPALSAPQISPDGTQIVYVRAQVNATTMKPESHLWLCDIDGTNRRQLTQTSPRNADPVWSPDGTRIAFTTRREGAHPNAIAILPLDGAEPRIITQHATTIQQLAWSPDGTQLAYVVPVDPDNPHETPRDPNVAAPVRILTRLDYKQDGLGFLNNVRTQLFIVDVATSARRQLTKALVDHGRPAWSPDGTTIAVHLPNRNAARAQIGLVDVATKELRTLGAYDGVVGLFAWSPDGTQILSSGAQSPTPHPDYQLATIATGEIHAVTNDVHFLPDVGYQSGGVPGAPVWLDETTALVHGLWKGGSGIWKVDLATGETTEVGYWQEIHTGFSVSRDGSTVVQTIVHLDGVIGLVTIDVATGEKTLLFNEAADVFAETPTAPWEFVTIERKGFTIEAWLLFPPDFDETKTYPLVLDVHGGPHNAYGYGINPLAEVLATNGYVVLLPNPRGSGTYGRAFAEAVTGDWGGDDWGDLEAMLDHVLERPYLDREQTGIYGYSYGGYMVAWVLGHTDRFKATVCGAPVFDFESTYGQSDMGHMRGTGEAPWENRAYIEGRSPISHIHHAVTPTLIIQGEADDRCPVEQSEQLFVSLKKVGVETEFVRYPGASHLFVNGGEPTHRIDHLERVLAWFDRFVR